MAAPWMSPDTKENSRLSDVRRAPRGTSASEDPVCGALENGTRVLWAAQMGKYRTKELTLAKAVRAGSAQRHVVSGKTGCFPAINSGRWRWKTGADLLWRTKQTAHLDVEQRLPDGSY